MSIELSNPIFHDEDAARAHLEAIRWPDGPNCPHCGNADTSKLKRLEGKSHRPGLFQCNKCEGHFTVTVGSVMERSHIKLHKWVAALHLMNASKKGVSAHQLHRMLGITYKSAWFMVHRIREAMANPAPGPMGTSGGSVQSDETLYGGASRRAKSYKPGKEGYENKSRVVALVDEQTGEARAFHVERANVPTVRAILVENVMRKAVLVMDERALCKRTGKEFSAHETVFHKAEEYVNARGYTTNNFENFFGVFKRGMRGVYHFCGEQHLQRYLSEFSFRYSNRAGLGVNEAERAALSIKGATGKRLTYRQAN